ncbi:DUF1127 domain-containing protein [Inquilinus ginsengisoli]|uniref:DUF1127 domain-containing protein n=1 Tax=Inquilinus ginsengisoli TaxID=363840 RepID=UPI003D1F924C
MASAIKSQFRAQWVPLRILRVGIGAFSGRRASRSASHALSAMDDHLLKDIGVSRQEIDLGFLRPTNGKA